MFVFVLVCITLCPFWFCNHLDEVERAGCFVFIVLQMSCCCKCSVALTVPWVDLQCVLVFFVLFCCFTSQVNSCGHGENVSSPIHTFFGGQA